MAFWYRKRKKNVYVFTMVDGKQVSLPRDKVRHLDHETDSNIQFWVDQWGEAHEGKAVTDANLLLTGSELDMLVKAYVAHMRLRGKAPGTIHYHELGLRRDVIPFFLAGPHPLPEPAHWPTRSLELGGYLTEKGYGPSIVARANVALRSFYDYLVNVKRRIHTGVAIQTLSAVSAPNAGATPLQYTLLPAEVLEFARVTTDPTLALLALAGYFYSLRPQELFGLHAEDFRAGIRVETLECSKAMLRAKLYSRFAVNITRQRTPTGAETVPKQHSQGWVSCFSEDAARAIVGLLRGRAGPLFPEISNRDLYELWELGARDRIVLDKPITLKDLRRASTYWLGHYTGLSLENLMKHARHKKSDTTQLYMRRATEEVEEYMELDLDA